MEHEIRAHWLIPTIEAVTAIMCSAAPVEYKVRAACAALVDHAMASGAWLMAPEGGRFSVLAAEEGDEELKPIVTHEALNTLLLRRIHEVARQAELSLEPVVVRGFDAMGIRRDLASVALVLAGQVIGTMSCLFRRDESRSDGELYAIEVVARIIAVALQLSYQETGKAIRPVGTSITVSPRAFPPILRGQADALRLSTLIQMLPGSVLIANGSGMVQEAFSGPATEHPVPMFKVPRQGWTYDYDDTHGAEARVQALRCALAGEPSRCRMRVRTRPEPSAGASPAPSLSREPEGVRIIEEIFHPVRLPSGKVTEVMGHARDVTDDVARAELLAQMRERDPLTGCLTITALGEIANDAIQRHSEVQVPMAFHAIEIDRYGVGAHLFRQRSFEDLLRTVTERLREHLPAGHVLARRSEFSFVAMSPAPRGREQAIACAHSIHRSFREPIVRGHMEHFLAVFVGCAVFPDDGITSDEMIANADLAVMNQRRPHSGFSSPAFSRDMITEIDNRLKTESDLHRAVERGEFLLAYQPKVSLDNAAMSGVEALIRWKGRSDVQPEAFISIAEECGLIASMGRWVLRSACRAARGWSDNGLRIPVSVNVSTHQFHDDDFHDIVLDALQDTGCDPALIEIEVTESLMFQDQAAAIRSLSHLKAMGVKVSIDDFGMGFSNFSYLKNLPVDTVKIDRNFIRDLPHNVNNAAITKAIIAMADAMKLRTVAEGVEGLECLRYLHALGCDEVQGYYFSQPMYEPELLDWVRAYRLVDPETERAAA